MNGNGVGEVAWRNIVVFIALALGLCLGSNLLVKRGADPLLQVVAVYSPLLAALIVRKVVAREGFADAHLGIRGVKARYWVLAALLPLSWNTSTDLFDVLSGSCVLHADALVSSLPRVLRALPGVALFLVGEELGWRSYLVEKLRPAGPVAAFVICGLVWFSWHPNVWFGESATLRHGLTFFIGVMCFSFIFGWLYYASGSVWPCLAMHVFNNVAPSQIKGALTCVPVKPVLSDVATILPLLLTVLVLWRVGAFSRDASTPCSGGTRSTSPGRLAHLAARGEDL